MGIKGSKKEYISNHRPIPKKLPLSNKKNGYYKTIPDHFTVINSYESGKLINQKGTGAQKVQSSLAVKRPGITNKKTQKVAILSWDCQFGGHNGTGPAYIVKLSTTLAKHGHKIHVFTRKKKGELAREKIDGVYYHRIHVDSNIPLLKGSSIFANNVYDRIKKIESKEKPFNVIHCYNWHSANTIKSLQNGIPRQIIFTPFTNGFMKERIQDKKRVIKKDLMEYKLIKTSNRILCFDKGIGKEIQDRFSLPEEKISIIQTAFNWQDYQWAKDSGEVKKRYGLGPLDPLIFFVGKFNNDYGPDILVDAIPTLLKDNPQVRFLLVGDGELIWPIRVKTHYLLFEHAIHLVGHKEGRDLQELFQAADIVVIPNRITTTPYQVLAAWSSKKPVIATHTGGYGLIKHLENGILVYDHPKSIAWGVERILFDWEKGHEIAQKGWEEVQKNYTLDAIGRRIESIYQSQNNNRNKTRLMIENNKNLHLSFLLAS